MWGPGPRVRGGGSGVAAALRGSAARSVTLPRLLADYVYFENSSSNPYLIRRIEELNKVARAWAGARARVWAWVCVRACGHRGGSAPPAFASFSGARA